MLVGQNAQSSPQGINVQCVMRSQQHSLIKMRWFLKLQAEKPLLYRSQRCAPARCCDLWDSGARRTDVRRELSYRLVFEEVLDAKLQTVFAGASYDLDADDRISAEFEEVVMAAYAFDAQRLRPDGRQPL